MKTEHAPTTKAARHSYIAELLRRRAVRSQAELASLLGEAGMEVTQATLSRDLDELAAVKLRGADGALVYALPGDGGERTEHGGYAGHSPRAYSVEPGVYELAETRLARVAEDLLLSAEPSANIVVARTPAGGAHLLASAIDHADPPSIIGTVAGDDTVMLVCRARDGQDSRDSGAEVAESLLRLANRQSRSRT